MRTLLEYLQRLYIDVHFFKNLNGSWTCSLSGVALGSSGSSVPHGLVLPWEQWFKNCRSMFRKSNDPKLISTLSYPQTILFFFFWLLAEVKRTKVSLGSLYGACVNYGIFEALWSPLNGMLKFQSDIKFGKLPKSPSKITASISPWLPMSSSTSKEEAEIKSVGRVRS